MGLVKVLGFTELSCGCIVGRYREVATGREIVYVEEKGPACTSQFHRRNQQVRSANLSDKRVERENVVAR